MTKTKQKAKASNAASEGNVPIRFKEKAAKTIPSKVGVYVLCDLDQVPLYVGQSKDSIRGRVRRHITSARSDIIATRMIDVWEIAYVWSWPVPKARLDQVEAHLFHKFNVKSPLVNGTVPAKSKLTATLGDPVIVQLISDEEIASRRRPPLRLTRQAKHFGDLLDYFLTVKDSKGLRAALAAHFGRVTRYFKALRAESSEDDAE